MKRIIFTLFGLAALIWSANAVDVRGEWRRTWNSWTSSTCYETTTNTTINVDGVGADNYNGTVVSWISDDSTKNVDTDSLQFDHHLYTGWSDSGGWGTPCCAPFYYGWSVDITTSYSGTNLAAPTHPLRFSLPLRTSMGLDSDTSYTYSGRYHTHTHYTSAPNPVVDPDDVDDPAYTMTQMLYACFGTDTRQTNEFTNHAYDSDDGTFHESDTLENTVNERFDAFITFGWFNYVDDPDSTYYLEWRFTPGPQIFSTPSTNDDWDESARLTSSLQSGIPPSTSVVSPLYRTSVTLLTHPY